MEVWWSGEKVKLASIVLLVLTSYQNQFQIVRLQDEQNSELKAWINLKSKHTLLAFAL